MVLGPVEKFFDNIPIEIGRVQIGKHGRIDPTQVGLCPRLDDYALCRRRARTDRDFATREIAVTD